MEAWDKALGEHVGSPWLSVVMSRPLKPNVYGDIIYIYKIISQQLIMFLQDGAPNMIVVFKSHWL